MDAEITLYMANERIQERMAEAEIAQMARARRARVSAGRTTVTSPGSPPAPSGWLRYRGMSRGSR
jgi:hypothetical protein